MSLTTSACCLYFLLVVAIVGCGSREAESNHTHLWTAGERQHVWSYERVAVSTAAGGEKTEPQAFLKREIQPGETLLLDGGAVVSYDGSTLRVGKKIIRATHVHVERDGSIRLNAFIRSSD